MRPSLFVRSIIIAIAFAGLRTPTVRADEYAQPVPDRHNNYATVPGVIIDHSPAASGKYIGCPSIAILPNGHYVASHSFFGPGSKNNRTVIFRSRDFGETWQGLTVLDGQWWSTLFVHNRQLYIMGTNGRYGHVVIRRSTNGGRTWTVPRDKETGLLLADGKYHSAPVPVILHNRRIWRSMEDAQAGGGWPKHFRSFVMSAPVDANLLKADSWTISNRLSYDPDWPGKGWLEGNIVVTPHNRLVNILRSEYSSDKAAGVNVSVDGRRVFFSPKNGFIDFPGGRAKFTIRYDPKTRRYWALVNKQTTPKAYRNILALTSSADLRNWTVESIILRHRDSENVAWQYVDWQFDGNDIIAVSRTAFNGAHKAHDANYFTFHRIRNFRSLTLDDSPDYLVTKTSHSDLKLKIGGTGFRIRELWNGSTAFSNRKYVWTDVPPELAGMKYTQTAGGEHAEIELTANQDTLVYIASMDPQAPVGWAGTNYKFHYTDRGHTRLNVFRKEVKASEVITVLQRGWTGTIVIFGSERVPEEQPSTTKVNRIPGDSGNEKVRKLINGVQQEQWPLQDPVDISKDWKFLGGQWSLENGQLIQSNANGSAYAFYKKRTSGDTSFRVRFRVNPGKGIRAAGLILRSKNSKNAHFVHYDTKYDQIVVFAGDIMSNGSEITRRRNVKLDTGRWYTARTDIEGDQINVYLDNRLMLTVRDKSHTAGLTGVYTYQGSAEFKDMQIRGQEATLSKPWKVDEHEQEVPKEARPFLYVHAKNVDSRCILRIKNDSLQASGGDIVRSKVGPLPKRNLFVYIKTIEGRCKVFVLQDPKEENNYETILLIRDEYQGTGESRFQAHYSQTRPQDMSLRVRKSKSINIPLIDLSKEKSRQVIVDCKPGQYLGHPTTVLLADNKTMFCTYLLGHGGPAAVLKKSTDGGLSWSQRLPVPDNWKTARSQACIHRLTDPDGIERLFVLEGSRSMRQSVSLDSGRTWTPFAPNGLRCIVAPNTIVPISGNRYLALYVQGRKLLTIWQSITADGGVTWEPERKIADVKVAEADEPGVIHSPDGKQLLALMREEARWLNSLMMVSNDEGKTWSQPVELPASLTGDRHMPRYAPDGRLVVTFRDMAERSPTKGDFVAWVGTYDDIIKGREGQYRIRLLENRGHLRRDTGYAGLELLPDGTFVATSPNIA